MHDYFENYLKAIDNPPEELKQTFQVEFEFLKNNIKQDFMVLDVGCGVGRPTKDLAQFTGKIIAIDGNDKMLEEAKVRCDGIENLELKKDDALAMDFPDNSFDLVYASYNLIGDVEPEDKQKLINEMTRVAKPGGRIINMLWKDDKETTEFLKGYYPKIGPPLISIDDTKTVTPIGTFYRTSKKELLNYYQQAGLKNIEFENIGPVWMAVIGKK